MKKTILKIILTIIALVLVGAIIAGGIWLAFFNNKTPLLPENEITATPDKGGMNIDDNIESNGIALMSTRIAPVAYSDYGISAQAESAYTLTATITPADATIQSLHWTVVWKDTESTFAQGKVVTDYVTVSPQAGGNGLTATVTCLQAFGEQIIISACSIENSNRKASCTADYVSKIINVSCTMFGSDIGYMSSIKSQQVLSKSSTAEFSVGLLYRFIPTERISAGTMSETYSTTITFRPSTRFLEYCPSAKNNTLSFTDDGILNDFYLSEDIISSIFGDGVYGTSEFYTACNRTFADKTEYAFSVTLSINGEHSNFIETYTISIEPNSVKVLVNSVSFDKANIVF